VVVLRLDDIERVIGGLAFELGVEFCLVVVAVEVLDERSSWEDRAYDGKMEEGEDEDKLASVWL